MSESYVCFLKYKSLVVRLLKRLIIYFLHATIEKVSFKRFQCAHFRLHFVRTFKSIPWDRETWEEKKKKRKNKESPSAREKMKDTQIAVSSIQTRKRREINEKFLDSDAKSPVVSAGISIAVVSPAEIRRCDVVENSSSRLTLYAIESENTSLGELVDQYSTKCTARGLGNDTSRA